MEQKSVVKLLQTKESLYVFDAAAEKDILSAEKALALRFAADYREYVSAFGAASYCEHELTGICSPHVLTLWTSRRTSGNITPFPLIGT